MESLLAYHGDYLKDKSKKDVSNWAEIYKVIGINVNPINRFGDLDFPYNFTIHPSLKLNIHNNYKPYEECCLLRAVEILAYAKKTNRKVGILYSGGIDSTAILVAFMRIKEIAKIDYKVVIFMNQKSIQENPNFYYSYIRNNFKIISSELFGNAQYQSEYLMVDGEHNDQLFGTDLLSPMIMQFGFDFIKSPCSRENVTQFFIHRGISQHAADLWYDKIASTTKFCPTPIETIFDFFWWYNFNFKWQSVFFRIAMRSDKLIHNNTINIDDLHHQHFFSSTDFQNWSIFNPDEKIKSDWASYKFATKKFIFDFNADEEYFKHKLKCPSLANLFFNKTAPIGLTANLVPLFSIDKEQFYNPRNQFI